MPWFNTTSVAGSQTVVLTFFKIISRNNTFRTITWQYIEALLNVTPCRLVHSELSEEVAGPIVGVVQITLKKWTVNASEGSRTASYPKRLVYLTLSV